MPTLNRLLVPVAAASLALGLTACGKAMQENATAPAPGIAQAPAPQAAAPAARPAPPTIQPVVRARTRDDVGRVVDVEKHHEKTSGTVGTIAGGALGGLAGNQIGKGDGRTAATVAGVIGGAVAGRAIERNNRFGEAYYRVSVRMGDGSVRNFTYRESPGFRVGDRVRVDGERLIPL